MNAPWDDFTPEAWMIYSDFCADKGRRLERLKALRYAEGLRLRPRMVLVYEVRTSEVSFPSRALRRGADWRAGTRHRWLMPTFCHFGANWSSLTDWMHSPTVGDCLATPADFPGLCDDLSHKNTLLRSFYYRTSYDLRIGQRDGVLVLMRRNKHGLRITRSLGINA